jgi:hypothetical protein
MANQLQRPPLPDGLLLPGLSNFSQLAKIEILARLPEFLTGKLVTGK